MEGPPYPDELSEGMIPRALRQVFSAAQDLSDKGWVVGFQSCYTTTCVSTCMYTAYIHVHIILYNVQ